MSGMTKKKQSIKRNRITVRRTLVGVAVPLLGLGAFGASIVLAEDAPAGNLTRNPSFETDPAVEWQPFRGGIGQVALGAAAPNGAFGVTVTAGPTADLLEGYSIDDRRPSGGKDVAAGTQFVASAYIRAATPQSIGKLGKVWVRERADGSLVDRVKTEVKLTADFQKITTPVYTVQRNGAEIDVYVAQNPAAPGDAFTADLVTLTRNLAPTGAFTYSPASPGAGDLVTFQSPTVADPEGGAVTRAWDLNGDGVFTDATTPTATFAFPAAGTYNVGLKASDPSGATTTFTEKVVVVKAGQGSTGGTGGGTSGPTVAPRLLKFKVVKSKKGVRTATFTLSQPVSLSAKLERKKVGKKKGYSRVLQTKTRSFQAGARKVTLGKLKAGNYRVKFTLRNELGLGGTVTKGFRIK